MKKFTYWFVHTHPDAVIKNTTYILNAEDRETADDCFTKRKEASYTHLLKVTEEDIGDAPGSTRKERGLK